MSAQTIIKAIEVQPGNVIEFTGTESFLHPDNRPAAQFEYAHVTDIGGGWADGAAKPGEVVLYTENYPLPIIVPADADLILEPAAA